MNDPNTILKLDDIGFSYPSLQGEAAVPILSSINMQLCAGDGAAILGPSGCGKSTLLEIIGSLLIPEKGSLHFKGQELSQLSEDSRCRFRNQDLGFVFQSHRLLPQCSALENTLLPTLVHGSRRDRNADQRRAEALLDTVQLGDRMHHRPDELSMGQRQRVAVARALMNEPNLLLADEPTGSLDTRNSEELMALFRKLKKELRLTMVMVTHSERVAQDMDMVFQLRDGRLHRQ